MGILERIRGGADGALIQVVLVIIVVTFVFWGVGTSGPATRSVALVNGQRITDTEFSKVMMRASRGSAMSQEDQTQLQLQVLDQLIAQEVMRQEARRLGLVVSEVEVVAEVKGTPAFLEADGAFSKELYETTLKRAGLSRRDFEADVHEQLLLRRLVDAAARSVQVSPDEVKEAFVQANTSLDLAWVRVGGAAFAAAVEVSEAEVDTLLAADAARVQQRYEDQRERRFTTPRQAELDTLVLKTEGEGVDPAAVRARLEALRAELIGGADFAAVAAASSEDASKDQGGSLGWVAETQLEGAVAAAVFRAGAGALTEIVETPGQVQVLRVRQVREPTTTPEDEAKRTVARELVAADKAPAQVEAFAEELRTLWQAAETLPLDRLVEKGLREQTAYGVTLDAATVPGIMAPGSMVLDALDAAQAGEVLVVPVGDDRYVLRVLARQDADMATFDDQSADLRARLLFLERQEFLSRWRDDLVARAEVERFL